MFSRSVSSRVLSVSIKERSCARRAMSVWRNHRCRLGRSIRKWMRCSRCTSGGAISILLMSVSILFTDIRSCCIRGDCSLGQFSPDIVKIGTSRKTASQLMNMTLGRLEFNLVIDSSSKELIKLKPCFEHPGNISNIAAVSGHKVGGNSSVCKCGLNLWSLK